MSRFLLDTHALLWFIMGDDALSPLARRAIESSESDKLVSMVSLWEMGIKHGLGKLPLAKPFRELIPEQIHLNGFAILALELEHISVMLDLPLHHRDPFDRLLIAQALHEDMTLISKDRHFDAYSVQLLWE